MLARAKQLEREGRDIIHLEIGEPDFDTPAHICAAGVDAIRAGHTHYCPSAGLPELREAAAEYLARTRGVPIRPDHVLVANGAKPFLFFTVLATCNPGDEVIYPIPAFPSTSRRSTGSARHRCRCRCTRSATSSSTRRSSRPG